MSAADLLARLDKVRKRSGDSWSACCPAHDDRGPSLAIRELADGRVLVHCFAGCSVDSILDATGLEFDALFPPRAPDEPFHRPRFAFSASDALRCLATEGALLAVAASDLARGDTLEEPDRQRLLVALGRINQALELCHA